MQKKFSGHSTTNKNGRREYCSLSDDNQSKIPVSLKEMVEQALSKELGKILSKPHIV